MSAQPGQCIDLLFPVIGASIPRDHGYALYSAACHLVASVHGSKDLGIFPIRGTSAGNGTLCLTDCSTLRLRIPADHLPTLLPLAGKALELDGHRVRLGVPHVAALIPAPMLASPLVLIKLAHASADSKITPDLFLAAANKQLAVLNIRGTAVFQHIRTGPRAGEPRRRVIHVRDQTHVDYAMIVQGLTAEESILLQERGLGGRRLMGCGLFLPERGQSTCQI
jgi:CRISPR-associated protein Cas6